VKTNIYGLAYNWL